MSREPTEKPELTFDRITVGEIYAERRYVVEAATIAEYNRLTGAPTRTRPSSAGTPPRLIVPPTLLAMWTPPRICFDRWTIPVGGIHTGQEWIAHTEVVDGDVVILKVIAAKTFERNQRRVVVFESRFSDTDSRPIAEGRMTVIWPR
jgi:hypothetical protein